MSNLVRVNLSKKFESEVREGLGSRRGNHEMKHSRMLSRKLVDTKRDIQKRKMIRDKLKVDVLSSLANLSICRDKPPQQTSRKNGISVLSQLEGLESQTFLNRNRSRANSKPYREERTANFIKQAKKSVKIEKSREFSQLQGRKLAHESKASLMSYQSTTETLTVKTVGCDSKAIKPRMPCTLQGLSAFVAPGKGRDISPDELKTEKKKLPEGRNKTSGVSMLERLENSSPSIDEEDKVASRTVKEKQRPRSIDCKIVPSAIAQTVPLHEGIAIVASENPAGETFEDAKQRSDPTAPLVEGLGTFIKENRPDVSTIKVHSKDVRQPDHNNIRAPGLVGLFEHSCTVSQKRKRTQIASSDVPVALITFGHDDQSVLSDVALSPAFGPSPMKQASTSLKSTNSHLELTTVIHDINVTSPGPLNKRLDSRETPSNQPDNLMADTREEDLPITPQSSHAKPTCDNSQSRIEKPQSVIMPERSRRARFPTNRFGDYVSIFDGAVTNEPNKKHFKTSPPGMKLCEPEVADEEIRIAEIDSSNEKCKGNSGTEVEESNLGRPTRQRCEPNRFGDFMEISAGSPFATEDDFFEKEYGPNNESTEEESIIGEDGWSERQVVRLHHAHQIVDPTSTSFWTDVARIANINKASSECQRKWFSLVQTPAQARRSQKIKSPLSDLRHDDIFESTPFRKYKDPDKHEALSNGKAPCDFLNIQFGSAIKIDIENIRVNKDSGSDEEENVFPSVDVNKPGYKSYIQGLKRDMKKAANSKRHQKTKREKSETVTTKGARTISESVFDNNVDLNIRMSPGGTLKVINDFQEEDDDFFSDNMDE